MASLMKSIFMVLVVLWGMAHVSTTTQSQPQPKNPTTQPQKYVGLVNLGNSCYMNAIIQLLYYCPPIVRLVYQHALINTEDTPEHAILKHLAQVFGRLSAFKTRPVNPGWDFYNSFLKATPTLKRGRSEDPLEFFNLLISKLPAELGALFRVGEQVKETFLGAALPPQILETTEPFVHHVKDNDVQKSLDAVISREHHDLVTETRTIVHGPLIMMRCQKNNGGELMDSAVNVIFQRQVKALAADGQEHTFHLKGIAMGPGHYWNVIQTDPINDTWYLFNDSQVHPKPIESKNLQKLYGKLAVVFFYMRDDLIQEINAANGWIAPVLPAIHAINGALDLKYPPPAAPVSVPPKAKTDAKKPKVTGQGQPNVASGPSPAPPNDKPEAKKPELAASVPPNDKPDATKPELAASVPPKDKTDAKKPEATVQPSVAEPHNNTSSKTPPPAEEESNTVEPPKPKAKIHHERIKKTHEERKTISLLKRYDILAMGLALLCFLVFIIWSTSKAVDNLTK